MIQSDTLGKGSIANLIAFKIFIQNICIGQQRCTPRCPIKEPFSKCKIISRPTSLFSLNSYVYSKAAAVYPIFNKLRNICLFNKGCKNCVLSVETEGRWGTSHTCQYYKFVDKLHSVINQYVGNSWRYLR